MTTDIPKLTPAGTCRDFFYSSLRELKASCGGNKESEALTTIVACVQEGINNAKWILTTLKPLKMNNQYLGMVLHGKAAADLASTLWQRDAQGIYSLISPPVPQA